VNAGATPYWKLLSDVNDPFGLNLSPTTVMSDDGAVNKIDPRPAAAAGNRDGSVNAA
jgi:hypothetical protein